MVSARANPDSNVTGSWHNSGYYGHFRSRVRNDYMNEYRQRAKPSPPEKFIQRSMAPVRRHIFSKHDSRERYKDNALYFADGNGRKQVLSSNVNYKPEFIAWMPHKKEMLENRQPLTSTYKTNFHSGAGGYSTDPYKQLYSNRISKQAKCKRESYDLNDERAAFSDGYKPDAAATFNTCYRKVHCTEDQRKEEAQHINTITTRSANSQRLERTRSARAMQRETVASCLSWARPHTTVPEREVVATNCHRLGRRGLEATPIVQPSNQHTKSAPKLPQVPTSESVPALV